jgi:hypothetical protein
VVTIGFSPLFCKEIKAPFAPCLYKKLSIYYATRSKGLFNTAKYTGKFNNLRGLQMV